MKIRSIVAICAAIGLSGCYMPMTNRDAYKIAHIARDVGYRCALKRQTEDQCRRELDALMEPYFGPAPNRDLSQD